MTGYNHPAPDAPVGPLPDLPRAACMSNPDVFGVDRGDPDYDYAKRAAKKLCDGCPETEPCLAWALANPVGGVWAGTTERQRRAIVRRARVAA